MAENYFDGIGGNSNGTANGFSREIAGRTGPVSVFVGGTFGTGIVTLQKFSRTTGLFHDTHIVWMQSFSVQGLQLHAGDRYRLNISAAGGGTAVFAEVSEQ